VRIASVQLRRINIGSKGQAWTGVCLLVSSGGSVFVCVCVCVCDTLTDVPTRYIERCTSGVIICTNTIY
jgi:hypothetical protein